MKQKPKISADDAEEFTQSIGQIVGGSYRQILLAEKLGVPKALGLTTPEWVHERLGGYARQSIADRRNVALELRHEGHTEREIAAALGIGQMVHRDLESNDSKQPPDTEGESIVLESNDSKPEPPRKHSRKPFAKIGKALFKQPATWKPSAKLQPLLA